MKNLDIRNTDNEGIYWFLNWLASYDLQLLNSLIIEESEVWFKDMFEGHLSLPGNGNPFFKIKVKVYQTKYPAKIATYYDSEFELCNKAEAFIFILSHEFYHFLRQTRQINGKQKERDADEFAKKMVELFRCA